MLEGVVGGVIGGGLVYLLHRDGTVEVLNKRPSRRYKGYPSDSVGSVQLGNTVITVEPPDGFGWNILGVQWTVTTGLTAGFRAPYITIVPKNAAAQDIYMTAFLPPILESSFGWYYLMQNTSLTTWTTGPYTGFVAPLPLNGELKDERAVCGLFGGLAEDTHRMFIYYEEFEL
jgi:hypothetical protein